MYLAAVFLVLLLYASYDIGSRTTFPGRKGHLRNDLENRLREDRPAGGVAVDTVSADSAAQTGD